MRNKDVELIQRVLSGDDDAFSVLVRKYQKQVHALAWRKIGDFHIAEEITQDTFLKAYKRLTTLKKPQQFASWLYEIAANSCSSWLRKKRLQTQSLDHLEQADKEQLEKAAYSEYVVEENERMSRQAKRDVVQKLLAKLKESERTVMTLHYFGDMSCKEIGTFLGVSANTVKSRLHRAQQRLQKEEPLIREALDNFQISPNLTETIMDEISRTKVSTPASGKPLFPWTVAASTLAVVFLILGFGNSQYQIRFQQSYSIDAKTEMTVGIIDIPIVENLKEEPDVRIKIVSVNVQSEDNVFALQPNNASALSEEVQTDKIVHDYTKWLLPKGAKIRHGKGDIKEIVYSPDGAKFAVASSIGIWIYNSQTGEELNLYMGHTGRVLSVSFNPDGTTIVSGSKDKSIRLWDVETGENVQTMLRHTKDVNSVSFCPDGTTIVSGSGDRTICLWDVVTGEHIRTLSGHRDDVNSVSFSPDGTTIVSGSSDKTIRLWDVVTGEHIRTLSGHSKDVNCVLFSPDGNIIASGGDDNAIHLWKAHDGTHLRTLTKHSGDVYSVSFSPDGRLIASSSMDNTSRLWHTQTGTHLKNWQHRGEVDSVSFSPDGITIATAGWSGNLGESIRLSDAHTGEHIRTISEHMRVVRSVSFSPDGNTIIGACTFDIRLWDAHTGEHIRTISTRHNASIDSVLYNPAGNIIASGSDSDRTIRLWDVETGEHIRTLSGYRGWRDSVSFSPDGTMIAGGGGNDTIRLWDVETGEHIRTLSGHTSSVYSVSFSPDGIIIASGSIDTTIRLWDVETGEHIRTLYGHKDTVQRVIFNSGGKTIGSSSTDGTIRLWDVETGEHIRTLSGHTSSVYSVSFSPDGKTIVSGSYDRTIRLWNVDTGEDIRTLSGHKGSVESVVFNPDGKTIASGSGDGTMILWELGE